MKEKLLHTPDGVRDIYGNERQKKMMIQDRLHHVLEQYGYHDIQTPAFEFFDIFNREKGSLASREMYKFFDRENNTLVLRPDITPSIARCVAKYYEDEDMPIRLCYQGNTFMNNSSYQGKLKETTQLGAELVNDDSSAADGEVIAMVVDCFMAAGLHDFQIEIGQVDFFKGLMEEAHIDEEVEETIRALIQNKNFFGLEDLIDELNLPSELRQVLLSFNEFYGGLEIIERAREFTKNKRALKALERLEKLNRVLLQYGITDHISYDLGMLDLYDYYTGIIFKGYTYNTGDALVKGGRYNNLLKQFGKNAPSIGFAVRVDELMMALARQKIDVPIEADATMILYKTAQQKTAIGLAGQYRRSGLNVELMRFSSKKELADYIEYGKRHQIGGILFFEHASTVKVINLSSGQVDEVNLSDFMKGLEA